MKLLKVELQNKIEQEPCKDENNNFQYNVRPNLYNNYDRT